MKIIDEFKAFALRGNAIDLAIGVVIGAAFNAITNSIVTDIITPPLSILTGGIDFGELVLPLNGTAATIHYGNLIEAVLNFILIALALFILMRFVNRLTASHKEMPKESKSPELQVLEEIRDSLKK